MRVRVKGTTKGISKLETPSGILIPAIERVLNKRVTGKERKHGWNSPSGVGGCQRNNYFTRTSVTPDFPQNDPRLQRIFDNGTCVHIRLQDYMKKDGVLLKDEAPLFNKEYKILGTTDGLLNDSGVLAVLEIKSIHAFGFSSLKDAKPEHKLQASIYMYCLNEMRKALLRGKRLELEQDYLTKLQTFLDEGKVQKQFRDFCKTLDILEKYPKPIKKVIFLYENKDTQELKEFSVEDDGSVIAQALEKFDSLNIAIENEEIPPASKTYMCNGCKFRKVCATID